MPGPAKFPIGASATLAELEADRDQRVAGTPVAADSLPATDGAIGLGAYEAVAGEAFAAGAEAALIASIVHERPDRLPELKLELREAGWNVRS